MSNLFQRLRDLMPLPPVSVGTVLAIHDDFTSTVQLPGALPTAGYAGNVATGSLIRPRGNHVPVGKKAFIRAGVIETQAPDGDVVSIPIGKVVLIPAPAPPPGSITWAEVVGLWSFDTSSMHPIDGYRIFPSVKGPSFFYGDNGTDTGNAPGQFGAGSLKKGAGSALEMQGNLGTFSEVTHEFRICKLSGFADSAETFAINRFESYALGIRLSYVDSAAVILYHDTSLAVPFTVAALTDVLKTIAIVIDSSNIRVYVDGIEIYTKSRILANIPATFSWQFDIGRGGYDYHYGQYYYVDELRVLNKCAYFANYTPAVGPFPTS